ncbi:MAG TPA: oxidoreductase [Planctomycetaceae bacterium]|nr:oxidoreductase [Planctomycetaceae bacterium]
MANASVEIERPDRWDHPLSAEMSAGVVQQLLASPPFSLMDAERFNRNAPLADILQNDTRLHRLSAGDVIFREGQYGGSAYLVLDGNIRIFLTQFIPGARPRRKWTGKALLDWWNAKRQKAKANAKSIDASDRRANRRSNSGQDERHAATAEVGYRGEGKETRMYLQDVPGVIRDNTTSQVTPGEMFGELAAISRAPREFTAVAECDCVLLEIRWQGLKLLRQDHAFKELLDERYRGELLANQLRETAQFRFISDDSMEEIVKAAKFESFGNMEWYADYRKKANKPSSEQIEEEPLIAEEGSFAVGLWIVRGGFARQSRRQGAGHRTLAYLSKGSVFGLEELAHNYRNGSESPPIPYQESLRAIGYVDAICIPKATVDCHVLPYIRRSDLPKVIEQPRYQFGQPVVDASLTQTTADVETGLLEFLVEKRLINGQRAMAIDLDRCTRCDDCVRACASTHGGTPVFERRGMQYGKWMFAQACMHCEDPVCMIGCPTGAIHRDSESGLVAINESTCIGCKGCAESCPYDNIRMVAATDGKGRAKVEQSTGLPILQATKCDFCATAASGPACQSACPHDALFRFDLSDGDEVARKMGGRAA